MSPKWHLSYASGYIELGLLAEAEEELSHIPAANRDAVEYLRVLAVLLQEQKQWLRLLPIAKRLAEHQPDDASGWIIWAYATRRATTLVEAQKILLMAEKLHPADAIIQYNLGCYACQQGDMQLAQSRLERAIAIDDHFGELAATDPDFAPLRETRAS